MAEVDQKQVNDVAAMLHKMGVRVCLFNGEPYVDMDGAEVLTGRKVASIYKFIKTVPGFPQKKDVLGLRLFLLSDFIAYQNLQKEAA